MSFKPSPLSATQLRHMAWREDTCAVRLHRHDLNGPHHSDTDECFCSPVTMSDIEILSHRVLDLQQLLDSFHAVH